MSIDKKWEIHNLNSVNLQGDDDVTRSVDTFLYIFIFVWATILISPLKKYLSSVYFLLVIVLAFSWYFYKQKREKSCFLRYLVTSFINKPSSLVESFLDRLCTPMMKKEVEQISFLTTISLVVITLFNIYESINLEYIKSIDIFETITLAIIAFYAIWHLLFNRNFILYDLLYKFRLKIKLITIKENLSPFSPLVVEFERIILGLNRNSSSKEKENFDDSIIFFWIRKDKEKSRERSLSQFIPYLSLITILFVLKEKSYKFVAIIGSYFSFVGLLFIIFHTYIIDKLNNLKLLPDSATISTITIFLLVAWYLLTIYNIYNLIDIGKYIKRVNETARRAKIKKDFNFSKGYSSILGTFDRDNAVYIYDYTFDKYQEVNSSFISKNLNSSKRLIDRNIAALITIIISMVLVVFVEITANGIFQTIVQNNTTPATLEAPQRR